MIGLQRVSLEFMRALKTAWKLGDHSSIAWDFFVGLLPIPCLSLIDDPRENFVFCYINSTSMLHFHASTQYYQTTMDL